MNTDAQRARNKRKRAKARAKKRGETSSVYRYLVYGYHYLAISDSSGHGLLNAAAEIAEAYRGKHPLGGRFNSGIRVSSGASLKTPVLLDIDCAVNTLRQFPGDTYQLGIKMWRDGKQEARKWQGIVGEDLVLAAEIAAVLQEWVGRI